MRYGEQIFEVGRRPGRDRLAAPRTCCRRSRDAFHRRHEQLYTYALPDQEAVLVNARVAVIGELPAPPLEPDLPERAPAPASAQREIYLGAWQEVPVFEFEALAPGQGIEGPAIVESATTTVLLRPGDRARTSAIGWLDIAAIGPRTDPGRRTPSPPAGAGRVTISASVVAGGVLRERPQRTTPSMITMLMPGRSPSRTLSSSVLPAVCWARSMITRSAARPGSIRPQSSARRRAVLPVAKQNAVSASISPRLLSSAIGPQDAERLDARARRRIGAEDDALGLAKLDRRAHRVERGQRVAVVDDLDRARALLAQAADLRAAAAPCDRR